MLPSPDEIIRRIRSGEILSPTTLSRLEFNAVLDARDSDSDFEREWLTVHTAQRANWESTQAEAQAIEDIRREAFLAAFHSTNDSDLAAYIADDFELIARASATEDWPPFVANLWACYLAGGFPPG